jgi:uncharacterized protein (TIGR03084 family)
MAVLIPDLCGDLDAETTVLVDHLRVLDDAAWNTPTPAAGWTIKDQIGHLAYFDGAVATAVADPDRFRAELAEMTKQSGDVVDMIASSRRDESGPELLDRFLAGRSEMVETFVHADQSRRVPWYGPEMSVASALTARIMETWAHGQDVFDALGVEHPPTASLRQVAHIGVRSLPNSFTTRGLAVPTDEVLLELTGPDGDEWMWGPAGASNRVTGPAIDFCLIVTQRRHPSDTDIVAEGPVATQWMSIAQAFAGPPGPGREPGQFRKR